MSNHDKYLENKFQLINSKFIKLNSVDKKKYYKHFETVFNYLIESAKNQDILLKSMYVRYIMAGSYADDLKISEPNEFDINIILKLPFNLNDLKIEYPSEIPGFGKIFIGDWHKKLIQSPKFTENYRLLDKQIEDKYMDQNALRSWFEGCIKKALNLITQNNYITIETSTYKIILKSSGPAQTLVIFTPECEEFSVDIVPVYEFKIPLWPNNIKTFPNTKEEIDKQINISWFAVPKPIKKCNQKQILFWRLSFTEQEKRIMHECNNLKITLRFLKKTRDNLEFKCIASYFIKTLFLHEIDKNNRDFWNNKISFLYIHMLKVLAEAIKSREIKFYWDHNFNMLDIKEITSINYYNKLSNLINTYEKGKDPLNLFKIFLNEEELEEIVE